MTKARELARFANDAEDGSVTLTNFAYTGTLTGGTGVVNLGSGQVYKDASGNVGIGTSSPSRRLHVYGGSSGATPPSNVIGVFENGGASGISILSPDPNASRIYFGTASNAQNAYIYSDYNAGAQTLIFGVGSSTSSATERMRITSAGDVGIGTSSPARKLDVAGTARFSGVVDFGGGIVNTSGSGSYKAFNLGAASGAYNVLYTGTTSLNVNNATDTATLLELTNSGNLGLGVTPSAWSGYGLPIIELPNNGTIVSAGSGNYLGANWYYSGGSFRYKASDFASYFQQISGQHRWFTAPSGTAGNAISFTQAMTLTAAGNLLVGTTTATNNRLVVAGPLGATVGNHGSAIRMINTDTGNYASISAGIVGVTNNGMQFSTDGVSRMVIDGNGGLALGTTSVGGGGKLTIKQGAAQLDIGTGVDNISFEAIDRGNTGNTINIQYYARNGSHAWYGGGYTERARINSSGHLLVGTTSPNPVSDRVDGFATGPVGFLTLRAANNLALGLNTTSGAHIYFYTDNGSSFVSAGSITSNGSSTAYNTSSDYRLKNITGDLTDSGSFIDALKPKVGTWKADGSPFVGFLAHEFAEVSPSSVTGEKDAVDADGKPKYQGMQAASSEVMANIIAELQSLRKRVAELEAV